MRRSWWNREDQTERFITHNTLFLKNINKMFIPLAQLMKKKKREKAQEI